jgi:hypothetical protein
MTAPEWARDEKSLEDAKDYLRQGNTIDFFELISAAVLREHPAELPRYALEVVNDMLAGRVPRPEGDFHPRKDEDNKYMRAVNMSEFLDKWVLALLGERPRPQTDKERLEFHKRYLADVVAKAQPPAVAPASAPAAA